MQSKEQMSYEKPTTNKHKSVNVVQGSGLYKTTLYYTSLYHLVLHIIVPRHPVLSLLIHHDKACRTLLMY